MKRILSSLMMLFALAAQAQNSVPNGDFETYNSLPDDGGQWNRVTGWTNAGGTPVGGFFGDPDYFHVNGTGSVMLPNTALATVNPHGGDAIMGFLGYHDPVSGSSDIREYLMVQLSSPLVVGQGYELSFWITNGDSGIGHYYQCDGIGACLSTSALQQTGNSYIDRAPQIEVAGELFAIGWRQESFTFTADSSYEYLTLGNFYPDSLTSHSVALSGPLPFAGAYYFVDDISLQPLQANSLPDGGASGISIYPNPAADFVQLDLPPLDGDAVDYQLCTLQGRVLRAGRISSSVTLDLSSLASGVYVIRVEGELGVVQRRLVKL